LGPRLPGQDRDRPEGTRLPDWKPGEDWSKLKEAKVDPEKERQVQDAVNEAEKIRQDAHDDLEKRQKEVDAIVAKAQADAIATGNKLASERDQRVNRDATAIGPGLDEGLQKRIYDAIKAGKSPDEAISAERAGVAGTVRSRISGIKGRALVDDEVNATADVILRKAADVAQNLILEGKKPSLDVKDDRAEDKAKKAADANAKREAAAIHKEGGRFDNGYIPQIQADMAGAAMRGEDQDALAARWRQHIQGQGRSRDVAADIVARGIAEYHEVVQQGMAISNNNGMAQWAALQDAIADQRALNAQMMRNNQAPKRMRQNFPNQNRMR
jgi:hypothetical protein